MALSQHLAAFHHTHTRKLPVVKKLTGCLHKAFSPAMISLAFLVIQNPSYAWQAGGTAGSMAEEGSMVIDTKNHRVHVENSEFSFNFMIKNPNSNVSQQYPNFFLYPDGRETMKITLPPARSDFLPNHLVVQGNHKNVTIRSEAISVDGQNMSQSKGSNSAIDFDVSGSTVRIGPSSHFKDPVTPKIGNVINMRGASELSLDATTGNIVFEESRQPVESNANGNSIGKRGTANAIYFPNSTLLKINTAEGRSIHFHEPLAASQEVSPPLRPVTIEVIKDGAGEVIFYGDNGLSRGQEHNSILNANTTVAAGTFTLNRTSYGKEEQGNFSVNTGATLQGVDKSTLLAQNVRVANGGTVVVNGGTFFIFANEIKLGEQAVIHSYGDSLLHTTSPLQISGDTHIVVEEKDFFPPALLNITNVINGPGGLIVEGKGRLVLTADNTYTGNTRITPSTSVKIGDGGNIGQINGNIQNDGMLIFDRGNDITYNRQIDGAGTVEKRGKGTLTFTKDQLYTGETIVSAGILQIGDGGENGNLHSKEVMLMRGTQLVFNRADDAGYAGDINGPGRVEQRGGGILFLSGKNFYTRGTYLSNGFIGAEQDANLGNVDSPLYFDGGGLLFKGSFDLNRSRYITLNSGGGTIDTGIHTTLIRQDIPGPGGLTKKGTGTLVFSGKKTYEGLTHLAQGTLQLLSAESISPGAVSIDKDARYEIALNTSGDLTFDRPLTGNGTFAVALASSNDIFRFAARQGPAFAGTVTLSNSLLRLEGDNTDFLQKGVLQLTKGNKTTVGAGKQEINHLHLDGGALLFTLDQPGQLAAGGVVGTNTLTINSGDIVIHADLQGPYGMGDKPFLQQDDEVSRIRLIETLNLAGDTNLLNVPEGVSVPITDRNNQVVATAHYDKPGLVILPVGDEQGLFAELRLNGIRITENQTFVLGGDNNMVAGADTLSIPITGKGHLTIDANARIKTVKPTQHEGNTKLRYGILEAGAEDILAKSQSVTLQTGTTFDMGNFAQALHNLQGEGNITRGNADLAIYTWQPGFYNGTINGNGTVTFTGSQMLTLTGNHTYSDKTFITQSTSVKIGDGGSMGQINGNIQNDGVLIFDRGDNVIYSRQIDGDGTVEKRGKSTLIFIVDHLYTGQTTVNEGTLQIGDGGQTGSVHSKQILLGDSTTLAFNRADDITHRGQIGGSGRVEQRGEGILLLAGDNSYTGGTYLSKGFIGVEKDTNLGHANGPLIFNGGGLRFLAGFDLATSRKITLNGNGGIIDTGAHTTHIRQDISGSGGLAKEGDGILVLSGKNTYQGPTHLHAGAVRLLSADSISPGPLYIDKGTYYAISLRKPDHLFFSRPLHGEGDFYVELGDRNNALDFSYDVGKEFTGKVILGRGQFALQGVNAAVLKHAKLLLNPEQRTTVEPGEWEVGQLILNGGALVFNTDAETSAHRFVRTGTLEIRGGQIINVLPGSMPPVVSHDILDRSVVITRLIDAENIRGNVQNLSLIDGQTGQEVPFSQQVPVIQNDRTVASGYFRHALDTDSKGLYLTYALDRLELQEGEHYRVPDNGQDQVIRAQLAGAGNLTIATTRSITLANPHNDYSGETHVTSGTLLLGSDHALGDTGLLSLAAHTHVDMQGHTQQINRFTGEKNSLFNLNGGTLSLTEEGTAAGTLIGTGFLNLHRGSFRFAGDNNALRAQVTLAQGVNATLAHVNAVGHGPVQLDGTLTFDDTSGCFVNPLQGKGDIHLDKYSSIELDGNNHLFAGHFTIALSSMLAAGQAENLGSAAIDNKGQFTLNTATDWKLDNPLAGSGLFIKTGEGTITMSHPNIDNHNIFRIKKGNIVLQNFQAAGDSAITVRREGMLTLAFNRENFNNEIHNTGTTRLSGEGIILNSTLYGTGRIELDGEGTVIAGNNLYFGGEWIISGKTTITDPGNLGLKSAVVLHKELHVAPGENTHYYSFTNHLTGPGQLTVDMHRATDVFDFSPVAADFSGLLLLSKGTMTFDEKASAALQRAGLLVGAHGHIVLEEGKNLHHLILGGGEIKVENPDFVPANRLLVHTLDARGGGTLAIDIPTDLWPVQVSRENRSVFDQDNHFDRQIIGVSGPGPIKGAGSQLLLTALNGSELPQPTPIPLVQGGKTVAIASYGITANIVDSGVYKGLWMGYNLARIDLLADQMYILSNADAIDNTLGAKLTGPGGIIVDATDKIALANAYNSYTGPTILRTGTIQLGTHNALGATPLLWLHQGTMLDVNGMYQKIGALVTDAATILDLNGGHLTITKGGTSQGTLTGSGHLVIKGTAPLSIVGANPQLYATTLIAPETRVNLDHVAGLGSGDIGLKGELILENASGEFVNNLSGEGDLQLSGASYTTLTGDNTLFAGTVTVGSEASLAFAAARNIGQANVINHGAFALDSDTDQVLDKGLNGSGSLVKKGRGTLTLYQDSAHTGGTSINAGALILQRNATLSGGGTVNVAEGAIIGGVGTIKGNVVNAGTFVVGNAFAALASVPAAEFTVIGDLANHGTILLAGSQVGNHLRVTGNYSAHSTVIINTVLGDDSSPTDKLIVEGDTSAHTSLHINNTGGKGALTDNGIRVVEVGGRSDGVFELDGRVAAGPYEYFLYKGGKYTPNDGDWYLRSAMLASSSGNPGHRMLPAPRPETGAYLGNRLVTQNLFVHTMRDRFGEGEQVSKQANTPSASTWIRTIGGKTRSHAAEDHINQDSTMAIVHMGGDIASRLRGTDQWRTGIMLGYGNARTTAKTAGIPASARGKVNGYSVGVYGTWYANSPQQPGPYLDAWVQYGWFNNRVHGDRLADETYKSHMWSGSLEGGWAVLLNNRPNSPIFLEPQLQVVYRDYHAANHTEKTGMAVHGFNQHDVSTRLGLRLYGHGLFNTAQIKPFIEANWWYNHAERGYMRFDQLQIRQDTPKNLAELKLGVQAQLAKQWNLWASIGGQKGQNRYHHVEGALSLQYVW